MNQNYNYQPNPLQEHFQRQETVRKSNNILGFISVFLIGFAVGYVTYLCIHKKPKNKAFQNTKTE